MSDNEKMTGKMESHFEKHGKAHCITRLQMCPSLMLGLLSKTLLFLDLTSFLVLGLKVLDQVEEETKTAEFPLITFIKQQIIEYFYNGDKFKILLVRLSSNLFKSKDEKNSIFQKLLSNEIDLGNKNDKKAKKAKQKMEAEEKATEKEAVVEEKSQKELQKEQLLKVQHTRPLNIFFLI